jgi:hypothetical protein
MSVSYVVAALLAMAAGYRAADHPRLECWRRFDRGLLRFALFWLYLLHGLAGAVVVAVAKHIGFAPVSSGAGREWANGVIYGTIAAALLRLEISSIGLVTLSPARIIFKLGLETFERRLDAGVARAVPRQLGDLQPRPLCAVGWRLFARHVRARLDPDVALAHADWLNSLTAAVLAGSEAVSPQEKADATEATEALRQYCEDHILADCDGTVSFAVPPPPPSA